MHPAGVVPFVAVMGAYCSVRLTAVCFLGGSCDAAGRQCCGSMHCSTACAWSHTHPRCYWYGCRLTKGQDGKGTAIETYRGMCSVVATCMRCRPESKTPSQVRINCLLSIVALTVSCCCPPSSSLLQLHELLQLLPCPCLICPVFSGALPPEPPQMQKRCMCMQKAAAALRELRSRLPCNRTQAQR